jgi:hypothetical protein
MKCRLTDAPRELKIRYGRDITYNRLYRLILDAKLAAERDGKYYKLDIEQTAVTLGLVEPAI